MTDALGNGGVTRLVVSCGDLPGLVASAIASEEAVRRENLGKRSPAVWAACSRQPDGELRREALHRQVKSLGIPMIDGVERVSSGPAGSAANGVLLDAATAALEYRCPVVVWPVIHRGERPDRLPPVETIADSVNRATLVGRLVSLDAGAFGLPEIRIETPFVDLTDQQLAELACDLGVRFEDCWWWSSDSSEANDERSRWGPLLPLPA